MRRAAMAQTTKKDAFQLTPSNLYLIAYNAAQTLGWLAITVKTIIFLCVNGTYVGLYDEVKLLLNVFQTLALLEIVHAATGLVRSNPVLTGFQLMSRVFLVWGIIYVVKETHNQIGVPLICFAWCLTEIVRYSFYVGALVNRTPYPLQFARYTLFIVLYPMGVAGEVLSVYASLPYVKERGILSVSLPNAANMSFNYYYFLFFALLLYIPIFPQLYLHMFSQRKKVLGGSGASVKEGKKD